MSYKDKELINKNLRNYHVPGCSSSHNPKRNAMVFSDHNTIKHELAKALGGIMLSRFGDIRFDDIIVESLNKINNRINEMDFVKDPTDFISEAVPNDNGKRRIDLLNLKTEDAFEFETNHKIKKEGAITIYI